MDETMKHDATFESLSALADGELGGAEAARALDRLIASPEARRFWSEVHVVGDSLRSEETGAAFAGDDFLERFGARLGAEPLLLVPQARAASRTQLVKRFGLPGAAVAAAIALVLFAARPPSPHQDLAAGPQTPASVPSNDYRTASNTQPQFDAEPYFELHRGVQAEPAVRPAELLIVPNGTERQP